MPFNTTLNWGKEANVEFDLEEEDPSNDVEESRVIGRATRDITKGQELFQEYGNSVAELVYRCGFAPPSLEDCVGFESDAVSIDLSVILSIVEEKRKEMNIDTKEGGKYSLNSETTPPNPQDKEGSNSYKPKKAEMPITNIYSSLIERIQALKKSGLVDESPWDGMDERLTAELTRPSQSFLESLSQSQSKIHDDGLNKDQSAYDDGGVSKLVGIFLVLLADDDAWKRASTALQNIANQDVHNGNKTDNEDDGDDDSKGEGNEDDESRIDDITSSVLLSSIANLSPKQCMNLQQMALDIGRGGNDPWRALLLCLVHMKDENVSHQKHKKRKTLTQKEKALANIPWAHVLDTAKVAICNRRNKLLKGEKESQTLVDTLSSKNKSNRDMKTADKKHDDQTEMHLEAINTISILRGVEKSILDQAIEILEMTSKSIL